jgi:hypothetical protein
LDADRDIGLLLPCNVVVRADGSDATLVQAPDPHVRVDVSSCPELTLSDEERAPLVGWSRALNRWRCGA